MNRGGEAPAAAPALHKPDGNAPDENGYTGDPYQPESTVYEPSGEGQAIETALPARHPGDWPDENGYAGPPYLSATEAGEPSASEPADSSPPNRDQFFTEPQPDQDAYYQGAQDVDAQWSGFHYRHVAGSALRPRNDTGWASSGGGDCIYATTSSSVVFNIHLNLPVDSRVDYLRLYYHNTSAANSQAWITRYDDVGGVSNRTSVSSSGSSGYGTTLSGYLGEVFDYENYSYVLNWRPNASGSSTQLCGLRVAYRLPTEEVYLPVVLKQ
ncbi:MAG: hypothetical protein ACUVSF_00885 [Anaerolineae bacterium]